MLQLCQALKHAIDQDDSRHHRCQQRRIAPEPLFPRCAAQMPWTRGLEGLRDGNNQPIRSCCFLQKNGALGSGSCTVPEKSLEYLIRSCWGPETQF